VIKKVFLFHFRDWFELPVQPVWLVNFEPDTDRWHGNYFLLRNKVTIHRVPDQLETEGSRLLPGLRETHEKAGMEFFIMAGADCSFPGITT
jgi:hypothetical protein